MWLVQDPVMDCELLCLKLAQEWRIDWDDNKEIESIVSSNSARKLGLVQATQTMNHSKGCNPHATNIRNQLTGQALTLPNDFD